MQSNNQFLIQFSSTSIIFGKACRSLWSWNTLKTKARRLEATEQSPTRIQSASCTTKSFRLTMMEGGALQLMTNNPALLYRVEGDAILKRAAQEVFSFLKSRCRLSGSTKATTFPSQSSSTPMIAGQGKNLFNPPAR